MALLQLAIGEIPGWAIIGVIVGAAVAAPLLIGAFVGYAWDSVSSRRRRAQEREATGRRTGG